MDKIEAAFLSGLGGPGDPDPPKNKRAWTTTNKILAGTAAASMIGDWLTTIDIARRPNEFSEINPLLGSHPSVGTVNTMIGLGALGSGLLASKLPSKWRNIFLGGLTAIETAMVVRNRSLPLRFNFNF